MGSVFTRGFLIGCLGAALAVLFCPVRGGGVHAAEKEHTEGRYAEDDRLEFVSQETYSWDKGQTLKESGVYTRQTLVARSFGEEEMERFRHSSFDEQNRLCYMLGYSANILDGNNYCEENIYERNDEEHTCRYYYYKANSQPYKDGFYVAYRYLFEVSDYQLDEEGRLLSCLSYRRGVGSDPNGYSEELFFSSGYRADYEEGRLMSELQYYDYWGTNEVGAWTYRIYQYGEGDHCTLQAVITEDEILLYCYEYQEKEKQIEETTYQVIKDWELSCEDGSVYYLRPEWEKTAVKKVAADGTVEEELFYGKAMDLGQQHYLMPEEVEETQKDHMYTVKPGDCLWKIAYRAYGHGSDSDLLYRVNRNVIGRERDLLLPGTRLYIPEIGNAQDTAG